MRFHQRTRPQPFTVASTKDGLEKLSKAIEGLKGEIAATNQRLGAFKTKHPLPPEPRPIGLEWHQRAATDEPLPADPFAWDAASLKQMGAAMRNLDDALRDIRAVRVDLERIAKDDDLRDEFRIWQQDQKK